MSGRSGKMLFFFFLVHLKNPNTTIRAPCPSAVAMEPSTPPQYVCLTSESRRISIPLLSNHHSDGDERQYPMGFLRLTNSGEVALHMPAVHCGRVVRKKGVFTVVGTYKSVTLAVMARQVVLRSVANASLPIVYDGAYCMVLRDCEDGDAICHPYACTCCWCNVTYALHRYLIARTTQNISLNVGPRIDVGTTTRALPSASSVVADCDAFWRHERLT